MVMASTEMAILSLENSSSANCTMKGMVKMEIILDTAVRETDRAKSPLAKYESMLDVGPPGQAANSIMPMAVVGDKFREMAMIYPIIGNNNI
tara:strand:+ start:8826 stop:9101 length:276 start_codon:yes stop_codon:yes gene_type:complete